MLSPTTSPRLPPSNLAFRAPEAEWPLFVLTFFAPSLPHTDSEASGGFPEGAIESSTRWHKYASNTGALLTPPSHFELPACLHSSGPSSNGLFPNFLLPQVMLELIERTSEGAEEEL